MRGEAGRVTARVRALLGIEDDGAAVDDGEDEPAQHRWAGRVRLDPGRRVVLSVGAAVVLVGLLTGWWINTQRPRALAVAMSPSTGSSSAHSGSAPTGTGPASPGARTGRPIASGSATSTESTGIVVHVAGRVRHPGVYRLPSGARVDDALRAAGGVLPGVDPNGLNLAEKLSDGVQVLVGVPGAAGVAGGPGAGGAPGAAAHAGPLDLNTATLAELDALPGVGPATAQRILDWRDKHGGFTSVDQLDDVSGIGAAKLDTLRPLVRVS
jgi:competence protein ComEA